LIKQRDLRKSGNLNSTTCLPIALCKQATILRHGRHAMTVIYNMVKGSIQSEQRQEAPATGCIEILAVTDLPITLLEVRANEAVSDRTDHCIHHIRSLLHED
jgi:hypothetical protein